MAVVVLTLGVIVRPTPSESFAIVIKPSAETSKLLKLITAVVPRMVLAPSERALVIKGLLASMAVVKTPPPPEVNSRPISMTPEVLLSMTKE